jgi:hypothetical protein
VTRSYRIAAIVLLTSALFCRVTTFNFVHADDPFHLDALGDGLRAAWSASHDPDIYIPVTYTVWSAVAALAGPDPDYHANSQGYPSGFKFRPALFHLTNLLVHAAASAVVFLIIVDILGSEPAAVAGALLFAWHPVQVEPMAWVTGLRDLLAGFFSLLALLFYVRFAKR